MIKTKEIIDLTNFCFLPEGRMVDSDVANYIRPFYNLKKKS